MKKIYLGHFVIIIIFILSYNFAQGRYILKSPEVSDVYSGDNLFTEVKGDLLTADIRGVTLNEVLNQLSAQHDVSFLLPPSLGEKKITVRFFNYKIDEGLKKILSSYNHIFIYTGEESNPHQRPSPRLKEVRIYPRYEDEQEDKPGMASVEKPDAARPNRVDKGKSAEKYSEKASAKKEGRETLETSSKGLGSKNANASLKAVTAVAKTGDVRNIGSLASAMKDKNPVVRQEAEKALQELGEKLKEESENDDTDPDDSTPPKDGEKNLTLAKGSGNGVDLELSNDVPVRGVQFTLNGAKPTEIRTTSRSEGFLAKCNEKNGTVVLVSLSGKKIAPGTGPIAEIVCGTTTGSAGLSNIKISE